MPAFRAPFCRFFFWFGVAVLFDPLCVAIVDVFALNWQHGEVFLLYHYYKQQEANPYLGIIITLAAYLIVCARRLELKGRGGGGGGGLPGTAVAEGQCTVAVLTG